jgi:hypothetical protein
MISAYNRSTIELEWIIVNVLDVIRGPEVARIGKVSIPAPRPSVNTFHRLHLSMGYNLWLSCH